LARRLKKKKNKWTDYADVKKNAAAWFSLLRTCSYH
jgi:hypothetical protein